MWLKVFAGILPGVCSLVPGCLRFQWEDSQDSRDPGRYWWILSDSKGSGIFRGLTHILKEDLGCA